MSDRQKQVIADLIEGINFAEQRGYGGLSETMKAALSLLKAREPIKPVIKKESPTGAAWAHDYGCGACHRDIYPGEYYCHNCGQAVKWDD